MATAEDTRAAAYRAQCATRSQFQGTLRLLRLGSSAARIGLFNRTVAIRPPYELMVCEMAIENEQSNEEPFLQVP